MVNVGKNGLYTIIRLNIIFHGLQTDARSIIIRISQIKHLSTLFLALLRVLIMKDY